VTPCKETQLSDVPMCRICTSGASSVEHGNAPNHNHVTTAVVLVNFVLPLCVAILLLIHKQLNCYVVVYTIESSW